VSVRGICQEIMAGVFSELNTWKFKLKAIIIGCTRVWKWKNETCWNCKNGRRKDKGEWWKG
jgi:hypothetical protein